MNNISLGRYMPYNSVIHRMDPRCKLLGLIFLMVAIFIPYDTFGMSMLMYGIMGVVILILMSLSKVKVSMLFKQLKALWFMMFFVFILNIFMIEDSPNSMVHGGFYVFNNEYIVWYIHYQALYQTFYIVYRLVLMVALTTILTASTKPLDLTYALEWYMSPLKVLKFPAHEIAMTISIALRFIPTLLDETNRIMKAQASRGVDFKEGKLKEKIRAIISLIIPLFLSAFQRSEELANAMESRGYDPSSKRTRYRIMKWHLRDTSALLLLILFVGGIITLSVLKIDLIALIGGLF